MASSQVVVALARVVRVGRAELILNESLQKS
jgi:hypothetical protein